MKSIAESSVIPQERLSYIVAGMYRVLSEAIRIPTSSLKQEVPLSKFQELRYNVALILKEMNDLEKRNILKIQD
ncbi:hypothetical protein KUCAC02_004741 [Chaenocephalus aceratus]|uniref:Uncharacterized protein n=1 Tax=Chaenocephalus aceratus TaxID=36190 RepID=A0ACB9X068_CHAAC|nr:hypothetical protein KUCAC02_004741 [Chaenocephalus aceratus]